MDTPILKDKYTVTAPLIADSPVLDIAGLYAYQAGNFFFCGAIQRTS